MLDSERERRLDQIYSAALKQDASRRGEFLSQACGGDAGLREEIESLLGDEGKVGDFLDKPALESRSLVGQTLGPYDVLSLLGAGGMGEVYSARDTRLGRVVALKTLRSDVAADGQLKRRLLLEAQAASALNDPRIVALYDVGSADGIDFLVMEYVPGETLDKLIARGELQIQQALEYAIAIAGALARAHKAGIIHRDLKPGNVMVTEEGAVKVLDFGLAKLTEAQRSSVPEGAGSLMSMAGLILGTAAYMSPEQAQGQPVDARSDIFSFGVVLYEMLTGQRPFQGSDRTSTLAAIVRQEPKPLRELKATIPAELGRVVLRCLRKDPNERFQDMADVKAALEGLQPGRVAARRRLRIGIAAGIILILFAGLAAYRWKRTAARGLTERQLTANAPEARIECAGISPDGKYLAYQDMSYTWKERDMKEYGDLAGMFLRSLDSGQARPIRVPADLHRALAGIHWFPDGGKLLIDTIYEPFNIWVLPIRGEAQPRMIYRGREPAISADGRSIAFINGSRQELWVGGINGEPPVKLAAQEEKDSLFQPAWSPDGRWIAYLRVTGWPRTVAIEARPARGGPAKTLAPGSDLPATITENWYASRSMIWAPGWRLIFALNEASLGIAGDTYNDGVWGLGVEPTTCKARGKPERLTPRVGWHLLNLTITADGKRLAFMKERSRWDVYLGDLEGNGSSMTAPHRLTFDTQGSQLQGWSLDSQAILITSRRNGKDEIFRQGLTETALEVMVEGSESVSRPAPTPDGLWLLYWEAVSGGRPLQRLMRRPAAGGPAAMVFETPATDWMDFDCPKRPGFGCEFSQKEGQDLVFYPVDPVRGKGERIGKIEIKPNPRGNTNFDWAFSTDGSRLGVVMDGEPRIAVLTLADRAWHEIPVPQSWGTLISIGNGPDGDGFSVISKSPGADKVLHVSAEGKVNLLLRKDWNEQGLAGVTASPDGKHLAFGAWTQESNVWMMEKF